MTDGTGRAAAIRPASSIPARPTEPRTVRDRIAGWRISAMPRRLLSAVFSLLLFCTVVGNAESEESEAPESAVSSPPMEMDDPGTPGPRGIEINFVGSQERMGLDRR